MTETEAEATDRRTTARVVLAIGIVAGLGSAVVTLAVKPEQLMLASDTYLYAGKALLTGEDIYAVTHPDRPGYYFLYPPIVAIVFLPHALAGTEAAAFAIQTVLNVVVAVGTAAVLWRALDRRGVAVTWLDGALLVGFVLVSSYGVIAVINGQVTLWLAFAFAAGFDALDRDRDRLAGAAFATAALVKVFPAAIGLWLLRRRAWGAIAAAVATGVGGLALGAVLLGPELTVIYLTEVLVGRYEHTAFDGTPRLDRSADGVQRQLAALFPIGQPAITVLAVAVLAPFVLALYRQVETDHRRQAAILGTIVATLLFLPLQPLYFTLVVFPLVVLLYRLPAGRARRLLIVATLVTYVRAGYETVELFTAAVPLPSAVETGIHTMAAAVFTVILPPTVGLWLLLVACLLVQRQAAPTPLADVDDHPAGSAARRHRDQSEPPP